MTALLAVVFSIAGDWDMPFFRAYIGVAGMISVTAMVPIDPDLLKERMRPGPGSRDHAVIYGLKALIWTHLIFAALAGTATRTSVEEDAHGHVDLQHRAHAWAGL